MNWALSMGEIYALSRNTGYRFVLVAAAAAALASVGAGRQAKREEKLEELRGYVSAFRCVIGNLASPLLESRLMLRLVKNWRGGVGWGQRWQRDGNSDYSGNNKGRNCSD